MSYHDAVNRSQISSGDRFALSPRDVARQTPLYEVQWDRSGNYLVWLEGRSDKSVLVCRSLFHPGQRDVTRGIPVRATVGYGGGDFTVGDGVVYFIRGSTLYTQKLEEVEPKALLTTDSNLSSPVLSPESQWLLLVASKDEEDSILLTEITDTTPTVTTLVSGNDFYMQPAWNPSGEAITWVSWDHPDMPWENSDISIGTVDPTVSPPCLGEVVSVKETLGIGGACFQPTFSPDGRFLSFVCDNKGWFNIYVVDPSDFSVTVVVRESAEHAPVAWLQGMRSHGWSIDSRHIVFVRSRKGFSSLVRLIVDSGKVVELTSAPYTSLRQLILSPGSGDATAIASSHCTPPSVVSFPESEQPRVWRNSISRSTIREGPTPPESVEWESGPGKSYGLYYRPNQTVRSVSPPLLIKIHGGPTSQFEADYDSDTLFYTSRGFAVLALNYRGSSGYGREYRNSIKRKWGLVDVEDVYSASTFMIREKGVDPSRIVLAGGSAGGFAVLLSLTTHPGTYRAGICRYAVSDLLTLNDETHKFESHYLEFLVGRLPEDETVFRNRSPLLQADRIQDPIALFQGSADKVVPQSQSDAIVDSLREHGVPHIYKVYPGEGHGFRKHETLIDYYETVSQFLQTHVFSKASE